MRVSRGMTAWLAMCSVVLAGGLAHADETPNGYAQFSVATDTIRVLGNTVFSGDDFSYEVRIRLSPSSPPGGAVITEQRDSVEHKGIRLAPSFFYGDIVRGHMCGDVNHSALATPISGQWHHIAWVRAAGTSKLYIDGTLAQSWNSQMHCTTDSTGSVWCIGKMFYAFGPTEDSFIGDMDWIRVSSGAVYTDNFVPPLESAVHADASTQLLLKFHDAENATTVYDESANHWVCNLGTSGTSPTLVPGATHWRVEDGGNGHWYRWNTSLLTWDAARESAIAEGGDLATATSATTSAFLWSFMHPRSPTGTAWLGARAAPGNCMDPNGYHWVTGEQSGYTNWAPGEPSGGFQSIDCAVQFAVDPVQTNLWNDVPVSWVQTSLIEWSSDCNNDGIVDYGQLLDGSLVDSDSDGEPDACEGSYSVPSEYPTIQAAIDAVPAAAFGIVQVAAGTFNEAFMLNGKNVVVRGSGKLATIIDGTDLTTSIARFTGGEPATAGLENLVLRNGIAGTIINPNSPFPAGGALLAMNSSAFLHNCRFGSNRARVGGAVYCFGCALDIANCDFISNTSQIDAGGIMAFRCAGSITGTLFDGNSSGTKSEAGGNAFKSVGALTVNGVIAIDSCTMQNGLSVVGGAAIEHYEDVEGVAGVLRVNDSSIINNHSGSFAGGIRNIGGMQACILSGSTSVCSNTQYNIEGPFSLEGKAQVCDCLADLTRDGTVNGADLGILLNSWGLTLPSGAGDVDHNGVVDAADLTIMLSEWGACTP